MSSVRGSATAAGRRLTRSRRRRRVMEGRRLPYLLILPAVCFELLIHIIPLLAGGGISFLQLNQYYIRNWTQAPWVGVKNYSPGLDFNAPIGKGVAHSFELTLAITVIIPYAMAVYVAVLAWGFMLDRDNGALNT